MKLAAKRCTICVPTWPLALILMVLFLSDARCEVPAPELNALARSGGQPGTAFPIQVAGANLEEADRLFFSHTGITATPVTADPYPFTDARRTVYGQFDVTIAADVPEGVYEVRAAGRHGISNPRPFIVMQGEHMMASDEHAAVEKAVELRPSLVVWDRCRPQQSKHFVIHANQGQELCISLLAHSLDSRAMLSADLIGPDLKRIQHRIATGLHDLHLHHVCATAGDYRVVVRDHLYQGGDDFVYLIRCDQGRTDYVELASKSTEQIVKEQAALLARFQRGEVDNAPSLRFDAPEALTLPLIAADLPTVVHDEAVQAAKLPVIVAVPSMVTGEFSDAKDQDWIQFTATAGEVLYLETVSQRIGQRTDPQIAVHRVDNLGMPNETTNLIAEQDDGLDLNYPAFRIRSKDPIFRFQAPADGTYRVLIRDLQSDDAGPSFNRWALLVRRPEPNFSIVAYQPFPTNNPAQSRPWGTVLRKGATESIQVVAYRRDGYDKPIELAIEGLPAGVQTRTALIGSPQNDTQLILSAGEGLTTTVAPIKISAREFGVPTDPLRYAISGTHVAAANGFRNVVLSRLSSRWILATTDLDTVPLMVQFGDANIPEVVKGAKISVPVKLTRNPGGQDRCVLRPQHLPPNVTMGEVGLDGNVAEGVAELQTQPNAPTGEFTIWLQGETKIKIPWNPQSLARAQQRLAALEAIAADANRAAEKPAVDAAIAKAKEEIDQLTKATAEREFATFLVSTPFQFRIVEPPKQ